MDEKNSLIYSSAVLCLSPIMEAVRHRTIDTILIQAIVNELVDLEFTVAEVYKIMQEELPLRFEEIGRSILRHVKNKNLEIVSGDKGKTDSLVLKLSSQLLTKVESESVKIQKFLHDAARELFPDMVVTDEHHTMEDCLLECVSRLMSEYGYAYAGQLAGLAEASQFVPRDALREACESGIKKHKISDITVNRLMEAIGELFDRRDPCLNNLAFCLCQRYYCSRLIGLDLPLDFLSSELYKDSTIYIDTNFMTRAVLSQSKRHNEFREIVQFSPSLGMNFVVSGLTIAESFARVGEYRQLLAQGEEVVPTRLLEEAGQSILESSEISTLKDWQAYSIDSITAQHLRDMGIKVVDVEESNLLEDGDELDKVKSELHEFDQRYKRGRKAKDDNALYHDAQLYHIAKTTRANKGRSTSCWVITDDNSIVAYGISKRAEEEPPYSIKMPTLLQTLSQFVESQALRVDFGDLFVDLISKDLLPQEQLFNIDDLKMLVGFDIKAREIPPEIIRKGMAHVKKAVLKGGGLTEENKSQVLYEFTKYLSSPEKSMIELQRRLESKIEARDYDIGQKKIETLRLRGEVKTRDRIITCLVLFFLSILLWIGHITYSDDLLGFAKRPQFLTVAIQLILFYVGSAILFPEKRWLAAISGGALAIISIIAGFA